MKAKQITTEELRVTDIKSAKRPAPSSVWKDLYLCLWLFAEHEGLTVRELSFTHHDGLLFGNKIGIRNGLKTVQERADTLAHEIAHWFLMREDPRNLIETPDPEEEKRADLVGELLIEFARFAVHRGLSLPNLEDD